MTAIATMSDRFRNSKQPLPFPERFLTRTIGDAHEALVTLGKEQFALAVQHVHQGSGTHLKTGLGRLQRTLGRDLGSLERPYPADRGQDAPIAVTHLLPYRAPGLFQNVLGRLVTEPRLPGRRLHAAAGIEWKTQLDAD